MITAANKLAGTDYSRFMAVEAIDAEALNTAKEIFARYRESGVITGGRFEDDEWPVSDEKSRTRILFSFPAEEYEKHAEPWIGCTPECYRGAIKSCVLFHMGSWALPSLRRLAFVLCGLACSDFPDEDGFGRFCACF